MGSPISTANQTLQLDAGWCSIRKDIETRRVKLLYKVLQPSQTLAYQIATIANQRRTPWITEVNDQFRELTGEDISSNTTQETMKLYAARADMQDARKQHERLEEKCPTTT